MSEDERARWNTRYSEGRAPLRTAPDVWVVQHLQHRSPGRALDVGCGAGQNAIWMAQQGWNVDAVDISAAALDQARRRAADAQVHSVEWIEADLDTVVPDTRYDAITVIRFLDRSLLRRLALSSLQPGGILILETFSIRQFDRADNQLKTRAFALDPIELTELLPGLSIRDFAECELPRETVLRVAAERPLH